MLKSINMATKLSLGMDLFIKPHKYIARVRYVASQWVACDDGRKYSRVNGTVVSDNHSDTTGTAFIICDDPVGPIATISAKEMEERKLLIRRITDTDWKLVRLGDLRKIWKIIIS